MTNRKPQRTKVANMQELLDAALRKTSEDALGTQTSSQAKIDKDDIKVVEGERSAENDAAISEYLGPNDPNKPPLNTDGNLNVAMNATEIVATEEPNDFDKKKTEIDPARDPGTSLPGAELGGSTIEKSAAWRKRANVALQRYLAKQVNKEAAQTAAPATKTAKTADTAPAAASDNIYLQLAGQNPELAQGLYSKVAHMINDARQVGHTEARKVAAYLALAKRAEEEAAAEEAAEAPKEEGSEGGEGGGDSAPPAADAGAGDPMAAAGGAPAAGAGGGDTASMITELIMQLPPEAQMQLLQQLMGSMGGGAGAGAGAPPPADPAAMGGAGAGAPPMDPAAMGGMPPAAGGGEDPAMMEQALGELGGEMGADPTKMAALMKYAREYESLGRKEAIKKHARKYVQEAITRGQRH